MSEHNYGVIQGGVYETRHEAVGQAAILNRDKQADIHRVMVIPDVIGGMQILADALGPAMGSLAEAFQPMVEHPDTEQ